MTLFTDLFIYLSIYQKQQQQQCIYLKKYKVYNTLCPANSYNANLGRTKDVIKLHKKKEKK